MTVDVQRQNDSRWHFALGPVEKWIVGAVAAAVVILPGYFINQILTKQQTQADLLVKVDTSTQLISQQMVMLSAQFADIPAMRTAIAELKVKTDANAEAIKELRANRGLR